MRAALRNMEAVVTRLVGERGGEGVASAYWTGGRRGAGAAGAGSAGGGDGRGAAALVGGGPAAGPVPLRGIILREDSDTTFVVQAATAEEVAAYGVGAEVSVSPVAARVPERDRFFGASAGAFPCAAPGETLYTADGRPAAIVTGLHLHRDRFDVSAFGDDTQSFIAGPRHIDMEVEALPFDTGARGR